MKKAILGIATFLIIFFMTLIVRFPYGDLLTSYCSGLNKVNKLNIVWEKQITSFPSMKLIGVKILSDEREVAAFDKLDLQLNLGVITFSGSKEGCKINGRAGFNEISYSMNSLPIPEFLRTNLGTGIVSLSGTYDVKQKKGKGKFDAAIDRFPNPLISGSLTVIGQTTIEQQKTSLVFTLKGASFDGKGTLSVIPAAPNAVPNSAPNTAPNTAPNAVPNSAPQVAGVLEIKVGQTSLIFNVQGTLDNVTITKA